MKNCPLCQAENPPHADFCLGCGAPFKQLDHAAPRDVQSALTEALERQTATNEILKAISGAQTDINPVFEAIARSAVKLCKAFACRVFRAEDEVLSVVGEAYGTADARALFHGTYSEALGRDSPSATAVRERRVVQYADVPNDPAIPERYRERARARGYRAIMAVPMVHDGVVLGTITVARQEPIAFSEQQVELLETFADQAVIAIENVRLFNETQEALEQQTATSEILRVISSSPTDTQPVFDTIVRSAVRLCHAAFGGLHRVDGATNTLASFHNIPDDELAMLRGMFPRPICRDTLSSRAILDRRVVHIPDIREDTEYSAAVRNPQADRGYRTALAVPMLREDVAIGAIVLWRREVLPFTDKHMEMVQTFADQAVIAIENVRLFTELQQKNRALTDAHSQVTEALEQQTATSEILRVISRSRTDVQPVFDAVATNAATVCGATDAIIVLTEGATMRRVAHFGPIPLILPQTRPLTRGTIGGRAILECRPIHVDDVRAPAALQEFPSNALASAVPWGTRLSVPLVREGTAIGAITIRRTEVRPFTQQQIALLQTFADQAVIAIENVRLFTELQEKNRALTDAHAQVSEALEQQTATSEILRAIASSPTDVQPVFAAVAESAARLCDAFDATIFQIDGGRLRVAVHNGPIASHPVGEGPTLARGTPSGRAIFDRRAIHVADLQAEIEEYPEGSEHARRLGFRTVLTVPLIRGDVAIGAINLRRVEARLFTDRQVALLETFANQAVIAIENVRLFTELHEKNTALTRAHAQVTEALEQQTATSEILAVISSSPTNVQPVFDAIVRSAVSLCDGLLGTVLRVDGDRLDLAAHYNVSREGVQAYREAYPMRIGRETVAGNAILDRRIMHVIDAQDEALVPPRSVVLARAAGFRGVVAVPLLRAGEPIGLINVARRDRGPFSDRQIELIQTFANQAVIAIENARLFAELQSRTNELTRSVEELRALREVSQAVSSTLDLPTVLATVAARATELSAAQSGLIYAYDETTTQFDLRAAHRLDEDIVRVIRTSPIRLGEGVAGRAAAIRAPVQVADVLDERTFDVARIRTVMERRGLRSLLAVPLLLEQRIIGALLIIRREPGSFAPEIVSLLQTFASQSVLAIENARLFQELDQKSRELEIASQHKSEFLANMSHELRTPLNAVIGFSDVLLEGMFGEVNEKQTEYLRDILASGQHLLSLINDILDLSKIEAGRMELELSDFDVPTAIENALTLMRERASRHEITLSRVIGAGLGGIRADERKFKQVLLNLLSNAVKFTPAGGRVEVRAGLRDGFVEVAVADTGEGIAPEDQQAVFEEFRQVGKSSKKIEGTGLGLALCRKFVELHGGMITLASQVGVGSTFTFTVPVRSTDDG